MVDAAEMVETIRRYGVGDERVLQAIKDVDRADFVSPKWQLDAYADAALAIGFGQTISQPYTVARMIELLIKDSRLPTQDSKVLEIGTGSGWQAAVLSRLFKQVYSIERIPQLAQAARKKIHDLKIKNIEIKIGEGKVGWREHALYQGIIVAADAEAVPQPLIKQLTERGRIVIPVRGEMRRGEKHRSRMHWESFGKFLFVPLV